MGQEVSKILALDFFFYQSAVIIHQLLCRPCFSGEFQRSSTTQAAGFIHEKVIDPCVF